MKKKVMEIFYRILELEREEIMPEELFEIEIDSLTFMKIIIEIEEEFEIELSDNLLVYSGRESIDKICEYINEGDRTNGENS